MRGLGCSERVEVGCLEGYGFCEGGGLVLLYAGAIYCMEYIVTATNYITHHLSFQLFP